MPTIRNTRTGLTYKPGEWTEVLEPHNCDLCYSAQPARYDARTSSGRWAWLCQTHFQTLGCSLGLGSGQRIFKAGEFEVLP